VSAAVAQHDPVALAVRRRASRRSVEVEVRVDTYVDATIYLDRIHTDDLIAELRERQERAGDKWNENGELEDGYATFNLDLRRLEGIRHLFLLGRSVEASDACRELLVDMLGVAL
jgi:hypothetical protein